MIVNEYVRYSIVCLEIVLAKRSLGHIYSLYLSYYIFLSLDTQKDKLPNFNNQKPLPFDPVLRTFRIDLKPSLTTHTIKISLA